MDNLRARHKLRRAVYTPRLLRCYFCRRWNIRLAAYSIGGVRSWIIRADIFVLEQTLINCLGENPWKSLGDFPWRIQSESALLVRERRPCCLLMLILAPKMVLTINQHWKPNYLLSRLDHNRS